MISEGVIKTLADSGLTIRIERFRKGEYHLFILNDCFSMDRAKELQQQLKAEGWEFLEFSWFPDWIGLVFSKEVFEDV
jgi:hypothetical protein